MPDMADPTRTAPLPLAGKTAIVTGGAKGVGRAICDALAARGASIALTYNRDAVAAEAAVAELRDAGTEAAAYPLDLSNRRSAAKLCASVLDWFGSLDVMVNNAGASAPGRLLDLSSEDWDEMLAVHARGFFHTATEAARAMVAQEIGGAIIGISGASALRCYPGNGAYGPAKAAVLSAMRQMAVEWAPQGIRVNCVCPGPVRDPGTGWETREPELAEEVQRIPLKRAASGAEVAEAVAYLATAEIVTGQAMVVDGGSTTTWYISG